MTWYDVIYRCGWGHRVQLVLGRCPEILEVAHGGKPFGKPTCRSPLKLVRKEVR